MGAVLDRIPLLGPGALPGAIGVVVALLLVLWLVSTRRLRPRTHLAFLAAAALTGLALWFGVDVVWHPFADGVGTTVWVWVSVVVLVALEAIAAALLGSARRRRASSRSGASRAASRASSSSRPSRRGRPVLRSIGALAAIAVAAGAAGIGINTHFAAYYTLGSALGLGLKAEKYTSADAATSGADPTGPLEKSWTAPSSMPVTGRLYTADVPASDPRFHPRTAWIYLPPAATVQGAPKLPLLVLMAGQPGEPKQWFTAGRLRQSMDAWAAAHDGLAPIVLVVDPLGSAVQNPLCSNADLGNVADYLEKDVPAWAAANLPVSADHSHWAIGGLSNGGTCTLQVVARTGAHPVFHSFLAMSAELHPTLGSEARTVAKGFGGSLDAYEANDPLSLFAKTHYSGVAGILSVGAQDTGYKPGVEKLTAAAKAAGLEVEMRTYPGTHSWSVWSVALPDALDWLGKRVGITG
ncbi:alpha/beta hydrolase [Actinomyces culturomici]|uniref:alpha/beta hydrolase n=1 Tax=Actinomyces culturomici TaxID=1926276 RepID=UPI000E200753|nr:alpha/beta hydrolase-fold protein [Actinomyces culturomici]